MAQAVIDLDRAAGVFQTQALQGAADGLQFALHQHRIAPVGIAAGDHGFAKTLPLGQRLHLLSQI